MTAAHKVTVTIPPAPHFEMGNIEPFQQGDFLHGKTESGLDCIGYYEGLTRSGQIKLKVADSIVTVASAEKFSQKVFPSKPVETNFVAVYQGEAYYSEVKQGGWRLATVDDRKALKKGDRVSVEGQNWVYTYLRWDTVEAEAIAQFVGYNFRTRIPAAKLQVQSLTSSNSFQVGDRVRVVKDTTYLGREGVVTAAERFTAVVKLDGEYEHTWPNTGLEQVKNGNEVEVQTRSYRIGDRINHQQMGAGTVVLVWVHAPLNQRSEERITVDFDSGKRVVFVVGDDVISPLEQPPSDFTNETLFGSTLQTTSNQMAATSNDTAIVFVDQQTLESFAKLISCDLLTKDKVRGIFKWNDREWVATGGSGKHLRRDTVGAVAVTSPEQWTQPTYSYSYLPKNSDGTISRKGQLVSHRKQQLVLTGEKVEFRVEGAIAPAEKPTKETFEALDEEYAEAVERRQTELTVNISRQLMDNPFPDEQAIAPTPHSPPPIPQATAAEILHDSIAQLEQERDRILSEGELSPEGAWIETGKVKGRDFRQAWWRATKPIFSPKRSRGNAEAKVKSSYIGEEGSEAHKGAIAAHQRRKAYERVCRQIELLEKEID